MGAGTEGGEESGGGDRWMEESGGRTAAWREESGGGPLEGGERWEDRWREEEESGGENR